jgi:molybdenum cofactor cytidylyltransferase
LSTSLRAGVRALPAECDGALVLLGDMPMITGAHVDRLIAAFAEDAHIIVPVNGGVRGNPVLWPATYFSELVKMEGDTGAKRLMREHAGDVREVDLGSDAIFADVDTQDALFCLREGR